MILTGGKIMDKVKTEEYENEFCEFESLSQEAMDSIDEFVKDLLKAIIVTDNRDVRWWLY